MIKKDFNKYLIKGYLPSIGIECHVQLKTKTKLFTSINNQSENLTPNQTIGPLCLGLPGTLPIVNQKAIDLAIIAGLSLEAQIAELTSFDRKHYFYPDLPLGYQISQHYRPIVGSADLKIPIDYEDFFLVRIQRAHLEADAGKLSHRDDFSLVDLNRVGSPLLEIVSFPDMHSLSEAKLYAKELYLRMIYAGVSLGDLSLGHLRFDVNVSVSKDFNILGTRTEIKNINSFRFIEQALNYEINRQIQLLENNQEVVQETRGYNENKKTTFSQRSKEDAQDYRYMPDPDIPPITISQSQINDLKTTLGITPNMLRDQFKLWQIPFKTLEVMLDYKFFSELIFQQADNLNDTQAKIIINWLIGDIVALINKDKITFKDVEASFEFLKILADLVISQTISNTVAKQWLYQIIEDKINPLDLAKDSNQLQNSDQEALRKIVLGVFKEHPKVVEQARVNPKVAGFLVGQVMQKQANVNPKLVAEIITQILQN